MHAYTHTNTHGKEKFSFFMRQDQVDSRQWPKLARMELPRGNHEPGAMVHAFNSRTWETRASGSESKSNLVYTVSCRTTRATQKSLGKK